jgi:hypothetical protein
VVITAIQHCIGCGGSCIGRGRWSRSGRSAWLADHTFYRRFYRDELPDQSRVIVGNSLLNPPFDEIQQAADLSGTEDVKGLDRCAEAFDGNQTPVLAHIFRSVFRVSEFWWAILGLNQ